MAELMESANHEIVHVSPGLGCAPVCQLEQAVSLHGKSSSFPLRDHSV